METHNFVDKYLSVDKVIELCSVYFLWLCYFLSREFRQIDYKQEYWELIASQFLCKDHERTSSD